MNNLIEGNVYSIQEVREFVGKDIFCRFGSIEGVLIVDNGRDASNNELVPTEILLPDNYKGDVGFNYHRDVPLFWFEQQGVTMCEMFVQKSAGFVYKGDHYIDRITLRHFSK
jgi:hypothetical protein